MASSIRGTSALHCCITGLLIWLQASYVLGNVFPIDSPKDLNRDYDNDGKYDGPKIPEKILKQGATTDPLTNTSIQTGIGCGYYRMIPNQVVQIQSSNYGITTYNNNEACVWRFTGDNCLLATKCPCFDVPASFQCLADYLKISDSVLYTQKFCGEVAPQGAYRSVSGHLRIRFRSDWAGYAGRGFLCYVFCTQPGLADPVLSFVNNPANCFNSTALIGPNFTGEVNLPGLGPAFSSATPPVQG